MGSFSIAQPHWQTKRFQQLGASVWLVHPRIELSNTWEAGRGAIRLLLSTEY